MSFKQHQSACALVLHISPQFNPLCSKPSHFVAPQSPTPLFLQYSQHFILTTTGNLSPEKVLEVWFVPPSEYEDEIGVDKDKLSNKSSRFLLDVAREKWEEMLDLVHCKVLSVIENEHARAYLLSESSMFVYEYQLVIKTCGTTTLLHCLSKMLEIAASVGLTKVDNVFYNRQNFFDPSKQLYPHQGFKSECRVLDSYFANGGAYIVGRVNENHYNFYNAECRMARDDPSMLEKDTTLEILMTGLSRDCMKHFYFQEGVKNEDIREASGIAGFLPGSLIDDYMFEPYGYSLNALIGNAYWTIHITPQPNCSFASFETNLYLEDYTELISKVLKAFQPDRFIVTHLANSLATESLRTNNQKLAWNQQQLCDQFDFKIQDDIFCHFDHYNLAFNQYSHVSKAAQLKQTKRRQDNEGSILKPNSPFQKGLKKDTADVPAFELDNDLQL